jgi:hypothetical protein
MKLNIELAEAAEIIAVELRKRFGMDWLVNITDAPGLGPSIRAKVEATPIQIKEEK